ncbi:hypothetical protein RSAG8_07459, partial [Rhizoctonia solani AG-8 WAC10335]
MVKPVTTRSKPAAAKATPSSKEPALPTSSAGSAVPEPLPTPEDSVPFVKPLTATAAKAFLFGQNYLESKTETVTAGLCSNLLAIIASHPDATETLCALVTSVQLILPSAFELVCETNAQLSAIADKKAEFAWNSAWDKVKDTDTARNLKLTEKPRVAFKAVIRLARGGVRYELGDRTQAALLSDVRISAEFEKGFGGASCRGQGATILLQCTPVSYEPEDPAAIPRFEEENLLQRGDVLSMSWCKPAHKRKPEQTMAVLKLEMRSHDLADKLITEGGQLQYTPVLFRKASQEPMCCLRCQKYGHKAAKCPNGMDDVCSQCGGAHRIANCTDKDKKWCVPCQSDAHCSFDRDCPSFKAEREKFNARRPENKSLLFGAPHVYDPRNCLLNLPPRPMSELWPDGGYTTLAAAQNRSYIDSYRPPRWQNQERHCKEAGPGESWDGPGLRTTPLSFAHVSGSNGVPLGVLRTHALSNPLHAIVCSPSPTYSCQWPTPPRIPHQSHP